MGADLVNSLANLRGANGKPVFSMEFLIKKYLALTEDDWRINEKMKKEEEEEAANNAQNQASANRGDDNFSGGMDFGGGGGIDFGGETNFDNSSDMNIGGEEAPPTEEAPPAES